MSRNVWVSVWDLTDDELDRLAADRQAREPEHAAEILRFKNWRRFDRHRDPRPAHQRGRSSRPKPHNE